MLVERGSETPALLRPAGRHPRAPFVTADAVPPPSRREATLRGNNERRIRRRWRANTVRLYAAKSTARGYIGSGGSKPPPYADVKARNAPHGYDHRAHPDPPQAVWYPRAAWHVIIPAGDVCHSRRRRVYVFAQAKTAPSAAGAVLFVCMVRGIISPACSSSLPSHKWPQRCPILLRQPGSNRPA